MRSGVGGEVRSIPLLRALNVLLAHVRRDERIDVDCRVSTHLIGRIFARFRRRAINFIFAFACLDVFGVIGAPNAANSCRRRHWIACIIRCIDRHAPRPTPRMDVVDDVVGIRIDDERRSADFDIRIGFLELAHCRQKSERRSKCIGGRLTPTCGLFWGNSNAFFTNEGNIYTEGKRLRQPLTNGGAIDPIGDGFGKALCAPRQFGQDDVIDEEEGDFAVFEIELVRLDRNLVVAIGKRPRPRAFEEIDVFGETELFGR